MHVATPAKGHPSYKVTISEKKLSKIVFDVPLIRGHPMNKAIFSIPQWWLYKGVPLYS